MVDIDIVLREGAEETTLKYKNLGVNWLQEIMSIWDEGSGASPELCKT